MSEERAGSSRPLMLSYATPEPTIPCVSQILLGFAAALATAGLCFIAWRVGVLPLLGLMGLAALALAQTKWGWRGVLYCGLALLACAVAGIAYVAGLPVESPLLPPMARGIFLVLLLAGLLFLTLFAWLKWRWRGFAVGVAIGAVLLMLAFGCCAAAVFYAWSRMPPPG